MVQVNRSFSAVVAKQKALKLHNHITMTAGRPMLSNGDPCFGNKGNFQHPRNREIKYD